MFSLTFYGNDGEFSYQIGQSEFVEYLFRYPRCARAHWTFDGDGWSSEQDFPFESGHVGKYYITRE